MLKSLISKSLTVPLRRENRYNNQEEALLKMYVARSKDLTANQTNNINCSRQKCHDNNCNFIPNYPKIFFDVNTAEPLQPWLPIEKIEDLLD